MDTAAYLKKQGWRGHGHSLDDTDRGIKKALQVTKKVDALGVGIQKYAAVSDQWWLRAYDQGLKELGSGKESTLAAAQKHGVNRGGLYARFTRGQILAGTIDIAQKEAAQPPHASNKKARVDARSIEHVKRHIQGFVDEAIRLGVVPPKDTQKVVVGRSYAPTAGDMRAVLKLAKMRRSQVSQSSVDPSSRKKLVRSLKRAAMKHMENQALAGEG